MSYTMIIGHILLTILLVLVLLIIIFAIVDCIADTSLISFFLIDDLFEAVGEILSAVASLWE